MFRRHENTELLRIAGEYLVTSLDYTTYWKIHTKTCSLLLFRSVAALGTKLALICCKFSLHNAQPASVAIFVLLLWAHVIPLPIPLLFDLCLDWMTSLIFRIFMSSGEPGNEANAYSLQLVPPLPDPLGNSTLWSSLEILHLPVLLWLAIK